MEKFLFTDGTNAVREVESQEELQTLIESATHPEKVKIWVFNSSEWVSASRFGKKLPLVANKPSSIADEIPHVNPNRSRSGSRWLKKFLYLVSFAAAVFLVYNFTRIKWERLAPLTLQADRPANTPLMDVDSLIQYLEDTRGQKLDKVTKTNLRIRNTWPERIVLQLHAERDSSSIGLRYYNMELTIDNSTGYNLDNAIVKLLIWKNQQVSRTDTFRFGPISYAVAAKRSFPEILRGDSLSISFQSIKSKVFNFCYSADKKSNYGNVNDRWFCRE